MSYPISRHRRQAQIVAALLAFGASSAFSAVLTWPNLGPVGACRGTLQACIDAAAAGDTVQVGADDLLFPDRYTSINEDVGINKSLTLRAASGIDAVFAAGRGILVNPPPVPLLAYDIAIEGVTLDRGRVLIDDQSLIASTYRVEGVRFNDIPSNQCAIDASAPFGPVPDFRVLRNVVHVRPGAGTFTRGICVSSQGTNWRATVFGNRVEIPQGGLDRAIDVRSSATGPVSIGNNTVVGRDFRHGIEVGQPPSPGRMQLQVVNNSVTGQDANPAQLSGGIEVYLDNADAQVINNTVVDGHKGLVIGSFASGSPLDALVANNLVAYNRSEGLVVFAASTGVANRNNLVFDNGSDPFVPGPGTRTTDPELISRGYPRPRDSSPAINAGSNSALPPFNGFDVDGQPRILLATVDIGAYEAGHAVTGVHETTVSSVTFNQTDFVTVGTTALAPASIVVATSLRTPGAGASLRQNLGVWLPAGIGNLPLSIFHEDNSVSMPASRRYAITVPGFGLDGYIHATTGTNISAQYTTLSHPALDGHPEAIAVPLHNYRDTGPYHDFAIGLEYIGTRWNLRNEDFSVDMPSGRNFNLVIAPPLSENAFRVAAPATGPVSEIPIRHPLLDDNACAAPIAGRVDAPGLPVTFNPMAFSLDYRAGGGGAPGRWYVVAENGGAPFPAVFAENTAFNVIVDGAQANECRAPRVDGVFRDGFEAAVP